MTLFTDTTDIIFTDTDFSVSATYIPVKGATITVRVIETNDSEFMTTGLADMVDRRKVIGVRASEVATPQSGDMITIGSTTYTVDSVVSDDGIEVRLAVT